MLTVFLVILVGLATGGLFLASCYWMSRMGFVGWIFMGDLPGKILEAGCLLIASILDQRS